MFFSICYSDLIWAFFFENNVDGVFQASLESIRNSLAEELVKMTEQVNLTVQSQFYLLIRMCAS
jgi:hypothetical protein